MRRIAGITIPLALIASTFLTVKGMMQAFARLAKAEAAEPQQLARDVSTSMTIGAIAIPIAVVAIAIYVWAGAKIRLIRAASLEA